MLFQKPPSTHCPVERCLDLVGNKWQLCLVWTLRTRPFSFGELTRHIPDISRKVLSTQLKALTDAGFVSRQPNGQQVIYRLTDQGESFAHSLSSVAAWAEAHHQQVNDALNQKYPRASFS
ncbi:MAG: winged helix-turn-helix transcriptional regulator [Litorivicinus sp.]